DPYMQIAVDRNFWERGDDNPSYYIIEDQYNHERYCYGELYGDDPFTADWLLAITQTLRDHKGWGLAISNIPDHYILIFANKLMVNGPVLSHCKSASEVIVAIKNLLKQASRR